MIPRVSIRRLRIILTQDAGRWLRPLLVSGVLLLSSGLAFLASERQLTLALLLVVGAGSVFIFQRWPVLGIIAAFSSGMVITFNGPSGLSVSMILVAMLLGVWLLDMLVRQRQLQLAPSRTVWPLLAFVVMGFLAFGVGLLPWFNLALHAPLGAQLGGLSILVFSVGTFLLVANQVRDLGWLSRMTWAFIALGALSVLVRSVFPIFGFGTRGWLPPLSAAFGLWLVAMAFSQAAFNRNLHPGWRLALGGLVVVCLYVQFILKFGDKSGWIPSLLCIAAMVALRSWRAGVALALVGGVGAWFLSTQLIATDEYSISTRYDAWVIMAEIIQANPIWGLGFANYYWYTPLFPIRGYAVSFNSHNNYIDIAAQTGVVGLACFLWFFWESGWLGWRLLKQVPDGFARAYVYGALGGLVGTLVLAMLGDWVLPFFYNIGLTGFRGSLFVWLFLGGLVCLEHMRKLPDSEA